MRNVLLILLSILTVIALAGISVNLIPQKEADNFYAVSFCSEMTKVLMKNPSSYKMDDFRYEITKLPDDITTKKINDMPEPVKELMIDGLVKFDSQKVFINYVAKNTLGQNINGRSICYFDRDYNYGKESIKRIEPYYFKINDQIVGDDVVFYSYISTRSKGMPGVYERKIKYLFYKIF